MLKEYKDIIKSEGVTGEEIAYELGVTYPSYKVMTRKAAKVLPKWVISFVLGYKLGLKPKKNKI